MHDLILSSLLLNNINKIETGSIIIDFIYILIILLLFSLFNNRLVINNIYSKSCSIFNYINKYNNITIRCEETNLSIRFKSVMYYINKNENKTITSISETINKKWSSKMNDMIEEKNITWKINQTNDFYITNDISGRMHYYNKEVNEIGAKIGYVDMVEIQLYSKKLSVKDLSIWVDECLTEYEKFIKSKSLDKQYIIDIEYDAKLNDIEYVYTPWESNVTFENRFFTDKDAIVNKIKFFIENPEWYIKRGIPYTLGLLLWGEPGCGKTGFIKSIMNLTKRHGVNIKLSKKFNMNLLKDIIYDEEIGDDLIIPQDKRILIFEDIDCMSDIVKDRTIIENEMKNITKNKKNIDSEKEELSNNNLSYLLNILDGLHECPGRIIIMTTNKPEFLDKALVRPGRIDYKINFKKATIDDIINILKFYWNVTLSRKRIKNDLNYKFSHADIINFCRSSTCFDDTCKLLNI